MVLSCASRALGLTSHLGCGFPHRFWCPCSTSGRWPEVWQPYHASGLVMKQQMEFWLNIHTWTFFVKGHLLETSLVIESLEPHLKPGSQQRGLPSCWVGLRSFWPAEPLATTDIVQQTAFQITQHQHEQHIPKQSLGGGGTSQCRLAQQPHGGPKQLFLYVYNCNN